MYKIYSVNMTLEKEGSRKVGPIWIGDTLGSMGVVEGGTKGSGVVGR